MPKPNKKQTKRKSKGQDGVPLKQEDLDLLISTAESLEPEKKKQRNKLKSSTSQTHRVKFEAEVTGEDEGVPVVLAATEQEERLEREREFQAYFEIKAKYQKENIVDAQLLAQRIKDVQLQHNGEPVEWVETLACVSHKPPISNPNDDLSRELSFYSQALDTLKQAKPLLLAAKVPVTRPDDYFAEMLKSDEHMSKVRKRLLSEQERIKSAEGRRKQREMKTFGKKVQVEREQEKDKRKKANIESIKKWRKDRQNEKTLNQVLDDDTDFNKEKKTPKGKQRPPRRDPDSSSVSALPVFKPKKFKNPVHKKATGKAARGGKSSSKGKARRK